MDDQCSQSKTATPEELPDFQEVVKQSSASDDESEDASISRVNMRIWKHGAEESKHWISMGLTKGSQIQVAFLAPANNMWVGERSFETEEPLWRFCCDLEKDLYVTYNALGDVTMEADGPNSYFYVNFSQGHYTFQIPKMPKYIGVRDGILFISEIPIKLAIELEGDKEFKEDESRLCVIRDDLSNAKWVCKFPIPAYPVAIGKDYGKSKKVQWYAQYFAEDQAYEFQPRINPTLCVTCDERKGLALQTLKSASVLKERRIKGFGLDSPRVLLHTKGESCYLCVKDGMLALDPDKKQAVQWRMSWVGPV